MGIEGDSVSVLFSPLPAGQSDQIVVRDYLRATEEHPTEQGNLLVNGRLDALEDVGSTALLAVQPKACIDQSFKGVELPLRA